MSACWPAAAARAIGAVLVTAVLTLATAAPAGAQSASLPDIEDEVMCPICGTMLSLSEAPQAERQRAFINELIAEGRSKEEIKDALVAEYGPNVLATPGTDGFDLAAWVVPAAGILLAAIALAVGVRRWRRDPAGSGPAAAAARLDAGEEERLRADLKRYEL